MAVLIYQIGIFLAIIIAGMFSKSARNTAITIISIFTVLQVFMSWLLLLQFLTILIAYILSESWFFKNEVPTHKKNKNTILYSFRDENGGRGITKIDLNDSNIDQKTKEKAILQDEIRKSSLKKYENDSEYKKAVDDVMKKMIGK